MGCVGMLTQILAAAACVGVVNAFHSGFGGGGFALVRSADNVPVMFDYRETAPRAALRDMFAGLPWNASMIGGLAVAVPGELRGYEELHRMYGKLPWHALFEPAITMARDGFLIPSQLYKKMAIVADRVCAAPTLAPDTAPAAACCTRASACACPTWRACC